MSSKILFAEHKSTCFLKMVGEVRLTQGIALADFFTKLLDKPNCHKLVIDLSATKTIDSTTLGLLAKLSIQLKKRHQQTPSLISVNDDITRLLISMGFDQILMINPKNTSSPNIPMRELFLENSDEQTSCSRILDAHRMLMKLNGNNKKVFRQLIHQLEQQQKKYKDSNTKKEYKSSDFLTT
ncbi:hypothetical protein CI610_02492 [invertebrate metagenome]|uniref:STAS domain-containing protein n=1 Tax=invertebrate metagenome TaxID=1711999 RepID=A0A2H9T5R8_9ZZZZ